MQYGNIAQLSAGAKYGSQGTMITAPYVALSDLGFGKAAFGYKGNPDQCSDIFTEKNVATYSADFVAANVIAFTVNGVAITPVVFDTNQATTLGLLVAAIQELNSEYTVVSGTKTITVTAPGSDIVITSVVTLGATRPTVTIGTAVNNADVVFLGAVIKAQKSVSDDAASKNGYVAGEMLEVVRSGYLTVVVDSIANCKENAPVYVITSGTNKGKFTGTAGSNTLLIGDFHFLADKAQDLAVVYFQQLPKSLS